MAVNVTFGARQEEQEEPQQTAKPAITFAPALAPEIPSAPAPLSSAPISFGETTDTSLDSSRSFGILDALKIMGTVTPGELLLPEEEQKKQERQARIGTKAIELGQSLRTNLKESPINLLPGLSGRHAALLLEETSRIPSAVMEQVGTIYSDIVGADEDENLLFKLGRTLREATKTPETELAEEGLSEQFERGLAQTVGFLGGGAIAKTPKMAGAVAAWLGSAVGGQAGREDAIAHGAEDWQTDLSFYINSVFGASEGLPIGLAFGKLDDFTGGLISKKIKNATARSVARLGEAGVRGAIDEGLQEAFQTFGENWTAADLAAYDPTRSIGANAGEAAVVGGGVGAIISMLMASFGIKNRAKFEARVKETVLDPLGIESLDQIAGPFSPISRDYAEIQKEIGEQGRIVEERAGDTDAIKVGTAVRSEAEKQLGGITLFDLRPSNVSEANEFADKHSANNIPFYSRIQLNKELEGDKFIFDRVEETPVVMGLTKAETLSEAARNGLRADIAQLQIRQKEQKKGTAEYKNLQARIEGNQRKLKNLDASVKEEKKLAKTLKELAADLMPLLPNGTKLVITNRLGGAEGEDGSYSRGILPKTGIRIDVINLDTSKLSQSFAAADPEIQQARLLDAKQGIYSTFLHEMGHAIAFNQFQAFHHKMRSGTATEQETKIWNGLQNDYMQYLADNLNTDLKSFLEQGFTLDRVRDLLSAWGYGSSTASLETTLANLNSDEVAWPSTLRRLGADSIDYFFSMEEYFAEEFAKFALAQGDLINADARPYFAENVKRMKEMLEKAKGRFRNTSPTMQAYFKTHSLRQQLRTAIEEMEKNTEQDPLMALARDGISDLATMKRLSEERDVFNWFMDKGFNILQIAERNPYLRGLQNYVQHLREWKNEVNNNLAIAQDRITEWKNLGREEMEKLGRLLLDESIGRKPDGGWLESPRVFTVEEIASYGLSDGALELRQNIKEDFRRTLDEMQGVLVAAKQRLFADNPALAAKEIAKVEKEFAEMKKRPYFPLMRFGEYTMQVRSIGEQVFEGRRYTDGQIIDFQAFDTKKERDKAVALSERSFVSGKVSVSRGKMKKPNFSLQGMPMTLLEHLEDKLTSVGMTEEVREAIRELKNDVLPFKSFRKQFQRRKRVEGYSLDAMRSYANYMTSFSNHIARVKFDPKFKADFDNLEASITVINKTPGGDSTKRREIIEHMQDHLQYVMNPVDEFVGLRSAAFVWYLGFNVKSAFVNMTQVPMVTFPYLAARYGEGRATAELTRAYATGIKVITNPKLVSEDIRRLVEQGMNESWLDESLATELALAASEKNLNKSLPRKMWQRSILKGVEWSSLAFHVVEKYNRHITAIAAFRLARTKGEDYEKAVEAARTAVEKTQYEYARWARPRFMRGKLGGTVFVFQNYLQNTLYFALGGDPGAFRMFIMMFMIAGLQGLPFGENIADLIDAAMTSLKKRTGIKNPHTQIRVELRKLMKDLEVNPDLVLHGSSSQTFGLAQLGEFIGWPIPDLDLSGSLSLGRVVPGTELLQPGREKTFERVAAEGLERGGGAAVSGIAGVMQALFNAHPDQWKRWEKAMPSAMRQISKAARFAVRGEEATRGGYPIAGFDMHDPRDQAELIAQALGFTPRDVSKGWEGFIAQQQSVLYYETWKTSLLRQWNYGKETEDQEAVKQANADIREYNSVVPFPEMKIGPSTRRQSFKSYLATRKFNAKKIEQNKGFRRLSDSIEQVYENEQ